MGVLFIAFAGTAEANAISIEFTYNEHASVLNKTPMFAIQVANISSIPIKILNLDLRDTWTHSWISLKSLKCPERWGYPLIDVWPAVLKEEHYILLQPNEKIIFDQVGSPDRNKFVCLGDTIAHLTFLHWIYPPDYKKEIHLVTKELFTVTPDILPAWMLKQSNQPWFSGYFMPQSSSAAENAYLDDNKFGDIIKLARQGNSSQQERIGTMYRIGKEVEQNALLAYAWYTIAERNQIKKRNSEQQHRSRYLYFGGAADLLKERLALSMTEEEIEEANKLAEELINKYSGILVK